jgi:hypothetical protein
MKIDGESVVWWNYTLDLNSFTALLRMFASDEPTTRDVEKLAAEIAANDFPPDQVNEFVGKVCEWGGYPGIATRIRNNNQSSELADQLRHAYGVAVNGVGSIVEALAIIQKVRGLGGVSFASKHLKFLVPDRAVVLDSVISEELGYATNRVGFGAFLTDCFVILDELKRRNISYNGWGSMGWRISDVEMAIFQSLKQ